MDDIERRLRIVVPEAAGANGRNMQLSLLQTLRGYVVARRAVLYLAAPAGTKSGSKQIFAVADVNAFPSIYDLFDPSLQMWRSTQSGRVVVKLDDEVMGRGVAVCEVGEIVEKGLSEAGLMMEDVLSPAAIALAVLEEREEAEDGESGGKEGEE
ncbi:uncharacterized protein MONOS_9868 [Monocercomonoides exilis]|uniref:uncharacterized protein n=1 Tax=Monocercomonoides exilis TaxID=2049356 RepID=UPI003559E3C1|nr:hypothetical protein MONOS_9868 [Monocercomonoides exilis]|eukprot:MONOS_9868.1-p1 / transcript=MONOS_9868.1 / gene=MONOS_9868 / organism=Monocercomonoides_exilis_PA203 / gene_product=unspecified product / transcript_product=unspecified product / location=Mono_scaffold00423:33774-34308(-) / protein_length=154 / sequence_SO=supercontig / SO=protein_coding / is_pseudo=false